MMCLIVLHGVDSYLFTVVWLFRNRPTQITKALKNKISILVDIKLMFFYF